MKNWFKKKQKTVTIEIFLDTGQSVLADVLSFSARHGENGAINHFQWETHPTKPSRQLKIIQPEHIVSIVEHYKRKVR